MQAAPQPLPGGVPPLQPGQQPTPQQIQAMQQQFFAEAARRGLTPQQFGEQLKAEAMTRQQQAQAQAAHGGQAQPGPPGQQGQARPQGAAPGGAQVQAPAQAPAQGQHVPIQPGPPKPEALALAKFLRGQQLKSRPCIFQQQRKEMFKVKRAIRALSSPAYEKARKKNPLLPAVTDRASAENTFKTLPISLLALRVSKIDPSENPAHGQAGHQHGAKKQKGKKGLWNVKIEQQQDANDDYHYIWLYEGNQWKQKLYAIGALVVVLALVLFPLWPYTLRRGVWYISMASIGLLAAFFGLAIVRLIGFCITLATNPPGIWLYPNLFEDVGFFDSFKPVWAWRETKESIAETKKVKKEKKLAKKNKAAGKLAGKAPDAAITNGTTQPAASGNAPRGAPADIPITSKTGSTGAAANEGVAAGTSQVTSRKHIKASVEEADDDE